MKEILKRLAARFNKFSAVGMLGFGIIWIIFSVSIGAKLFSLIGLIIVFLAIARGIKDFKSRSGKNGLNIWFNEDRGEEIEDKGNGFCPYCGAKAEDDYAFCRRCGRKLE